MFSIGGCHPADRYYRDSLAVVESADWLINQTKHPMAQTLPAPQSSS